MAVGIFNCASRRWRQARSWGCLPLLAHTPPTLAERPGVARVVGWCCPRGRARVVRLPLRSTLPIDKALQQRRDAEDFAPFEPSEGSVRRPHASPSHDSARGD